MYFDTSLILSLKTFNFVTSFIKMYCTHFLYSFEKKCMMKFVANTINLLFSVDGRKRIRISNSIIKSWKLLGVNRIYLS